MTTASTVLQLEPTKQQSDLGRYMAWAKSRLRKGLASQVLEIATLSRGEGKVNAEEYYKFQLYDDERLTKEEKRAFLGSKGVQKIYKQIISPYYHGLSQDKLLSDTLLRGANIPCANTSALYHSVRQLGSAHALRTPAELASYLRDGMTYPFFEKPVNGWQSRGVAHIASYDTGNDELIQSSGEPVAVDDFVSEIEGLVHGALFQEVLNIHPELSDLCAGRISTIRVIVLVNDGSTELFRAAWKIPANGNIADNFWRAGNLLADVDVESGQVRRAIRGWGPDQEEIESHPENNKPIVGITLPKWNAVQRQAQDVALLLPELRVVACDIGITDKGPVVVEINAGGDMGLPQMASGKGVMDERFRAFIAEVGRYKPPYAC